MGTTDVLNPLPVLESFHLPVPVAADADFDRRWAAWVERGRVHEQRVRRRGLLAVGVITVGAALFYAVFPA